MNKKHLILYIIILLLITVRVVAIFVIPLADTTEARYGHIAYIMATSNDWITPYFDQNVPFWGKPPFSFWMQAISYKIFGMHDFSARVPSMIFTIFSIGLIFHYLRTFYTFTSALWGVIIYLGFLLVFILSGAILTDPYLAFATTLSMISFMMVMKNQPSYWGYLFFLGIAIGLLTKGPLTLVLIGGALCLWLLFDPINRFAELKKLPYIKGGAVALIISLPWYIIAEIKTPGFLNYFIIGEHFQRFLDSGWNGDLYGSAHKQPKGKIWILWLAAAFPWVFVVLYGSIKNIKNSVAILKNSNEFAYFFAWSVFTMLFFTMSGNILVTYILPALSPLAILIAIYLLQYDFEIKVKRFNILYILALITPLAAIIATVYLVIFPNKLNTQNGLIAKYENIKKQNQPIYFIDDRTFSAEYYSKDNAILVSNNAHAIRSKSNYINYTQFKQKLQDTQDTQDTICIAIYKKSVDKVIEHFDLNLKKIYEDNMFILFVGQYNDLNSSIKTSNKP
ncbi:MAG: glycosyltransferase family 39 protein [Sulfurimonas sp.]|jgi:4-amino-4-deoxy-L-arabinose transferase-like glycosyltransferase